MHSEYTAIGHLFCEFFSTCCVFLKAICIIFIFVAVNDTTAKVTLEKEGLFGYHILIIIHTEEKASRIGT